MKSLKRLAGRKYTAEVRGYEDYQVYVELDEEDNVLESDCNCPYDFGPICKHQAAVFLVLRDRIAEGEAGPEPSLRELLEAESKETLVSILLSIASDAGPAEERIRLHLSKVGGEEEVAECRALIQSYIYRNSDQHGFVNWRSVRDAVEGAVIVADKAAAAFDGQEWLRGLDMHLCVIEEMIELLQSADDSGGGVGMIIESSLEAIGRMVQELQSASDAERVAVFRRLLSDLQRSCYDGWSDWQLALLESADELIASEEMQQAWDEAAGAISDDSTGSEWSRGYVDERVAVLRYERLLEQSGESQASLYLDEQLHFPALRDIAIRAALGRGDAEEAIRLAEAGEAADQARGLPGLVHRWKKHRFEAYRSSGRLEPLRALGLELVGSGEYEVYRTVKGTFPENESAWSFYLQEMLDRMAQDPRAQELYTRILVEERMFARLLAYVREAPYRIESFYGSLQPHFPDEVKSLFLTYIELRADRSKDRRDYADVSRIIRLLQQVGGREEAYRITGELLAKYPRRPAMREELEKLVF
ncbi:SWIM zinc finger family protein [Paenibacillus sp.]|uniref:SWIM zinc finger family protein n=1 Tax=Paenibacillus sp. TaxID=58172 RepID=UPI0028128197|nr:SWIM zinc finger family protein [Paenibacillus sp.]